MLSRAQVDQFWRDGFHAMPFGPPTIDGRPRFDMGAEHSAANRSDRSRGLYIWVYTAADAFPLWRNPMPNRHEGSVVRGKASRVARLQAGAVELPDQPKSASFFTVQGQKSAAE